MSNDKATTGNVDKLADAIVWAAQILGTGNENGMGALEVLAVRVGDGLSKVASAIERLADEIQER